MGDVLNFVFTPIELNHPDPFGDTAGPMEEDGSCVRLTEAFGR
ncbi:hypothetical protein ACFXPZ_25290 [Streptomyces sp. NPDC059101]